jgi:hypothetical protein
MFLPNTFKPKNTLPLQSMRTLDKLSCIILETYSSVIQNASNFKVPSEGELGLRIKALWVPLIGHASSVLQQVPMHHRKVNCKGSHLTVENDKRAHFCRVHGM